MKKMFDFMGKNKQSTHKQYISLFVCLLKLDPKTFCMKEKMTKSCLVILNRPTVIRKHLENSCQTN